MRLEIEIEPGWGSINDLKQFLEQQVGWADLGIELEPAIRVRGDPTVLVALLGAGGGALGALITGLLAVAQQSKNKKIVIQGKQGARLEIPADTSPDKVSYWIERLKEIDADRLIVQN